MTIDLTQPQIAAAFGGAAIVAGVTLAVAVINQLFGRSMHRQRIAADIDLAQRKFNFDTALAERKIEVEIDLAERRFRFDSGLAERRFQYDREFNDHKRRVELAEEVLAGFLQMRDVMREVRSPASFGNEGEDRPKWWQDESEPQARSRQVFFVPISRLLAQGDFINGLMAKRYQMNAYFGPEAEGPFNTIREVLAQIQSAARMMMMSVAVDGSRQGGTDLWRQWEGAIWAGVEEPDSRAAAVEQAIAAMAAICRPVLTGKSG